MKLGRIKYKVKHLQGPQISSSQSRRDRKSSFPIDFHHHDINQEAELDSDFSVCDVHSARHQSSRVEDSQVDLNKVQCKICWGDE